MQVDLEPLMSRTGMVARHLARKMLALPVGAQIPRSRDLSDGMRVGNGTVQAGLELLEEMGAISTTSRGRLGTFLSQADPGMLWEIAGMGSIALAMPLPYSSRYEGLATGVRQAFEALGIPLSLSFMRGSRERARAVSDGRLDLAVMSALALEVLDDSGLEQLVDLGPRTYVANHGLLLAPGHQASDPGLRVAVDQESADQVALVSSQFSGRNDVQYVDISYNQLAQGFTSGQIDAAIWNIDEVEARIPVPLTIEPISRAPGKNTRAVLVAEQDSERIPAVLFGRIDCDLIRKVQAEVMSGSLLPRY